MSSLLSPGKTHTTLTHSVYEELHRRIIGHEIKPGDRLVERTLADELDVSRVPVREALHELVRDGLAESIPRVGLRVTCPTREDFQELLEIRAVLDGLTFRRLAERWDAQAEQTLEDLFDQTGRAIAEGRQADGVRLNSRFHTMVQELAGSGTLIQVMKPVDSRMAWMLSQHEDVAEVLEQHRALVTAMTTGNPAQIEALAAQHIEDSFRFAVGVNPDLA